MARTIRALSIGLTAIVGLYSVKAGAQSDRLGPFFEAMERSKSHAIEAELRDGELRAFESVQRLGDEAFSLERVDLRPLPLRKLADEMKQPLKATADPVNGVTVGEIFDAAAKRDLASWAEYDAEPPGRPHRFYELTFRRNNPLTVRAATQQLTLPPDIFRFVSVSHKSRYNAPDSSRLAVIIHEPHASTLGQLQMIQALEQLVASNPGQRFIFLVEGDFERPDRTIPLEPWKDVVARQSHPEALIAWMVHNYIIEGAFAFRLLRERGDIPAFAIDDQQLLRRSPRQPDVQSLVEKIDALPEDDATKQVLKGLILLPSSRMKPQQYREATLALDQLTRLYPKYRELFQELKEHLEAFRFAVERDATMAEQIVGRMRQFPDTIPLIFIGNFHTDNVMARVAEAQPETAFLVLDVRGMYLAAGNMQRFQDSFLDPAAYLRTIRPRKRPVAPRLEDRRSIEQLAQHRGERLAEFRRKITASSPLEPRATGDLAAALARSPVLQDVVINFGAPPPKPPFGRAFASFAPGEGGRRGSLAFYNIGEKGWSDPGPRSVLIANALQSPPSFEAVSAGGRFSVGSRSFFTVIDPKSRRVYFFEERQPAGMFDAIEPRKLDEKDADIRFRQLAENNLADALQLAA